MKKPPVILALGGVIALSAALLLPPQSSGQAAAEPDAEITKFCSEISAQQVTIGENQAKMDETIAAISENVRLARIFAARGGGKAK
jgi:gas vesicle protein